MLSSPIDRSFIADDRGSATMELIFWLPLFVEMMLITADASQMYWMHGEMWTVARDTVRQTVSGNFDDASGVPVTDDIETYAESILGPTHTATYTFDSVNNYHTVTITAQESAMSFFGTLFADSITTISASYTMVGE